MANFGGTYDTGTVDVENASTTVVGNGVVWTDVVQGDFLFSGGTVAVIDSVDTDTNEITLMMDWLGSTEADASYVILKTSWLRYEPALTQQKARAFLQQLEGAGIIYYVADPQTEPDPAIGEDGQYALKTDSAAWSLWLKIDGVWIPQGTPVGASWKGIWDNDTAYILNDAVHRNGNAYIATAPNTNKPPEDEPDYWDLFVAGGGRYEYQLYDTGRPSSGETLVQAVMTTTTIFRAGLLDSEAYAATPSTDPAEFSLQKNGSEFATLTFSAGVNVGVFAALDDITFNDGDRFTIIAPSPRDATLAGISSSIVAFR